MAIIPLREVEIGNNWNIRPRFLKFFVIIRISIVLFYLCSVLGIERNNFIHIILVFSIILVQVCMVISIYLRATQVKENYPLREMGYMKSELSRYNQTSLYERVKKLLVSYEWSDCSFTVSGKDFKAHKLILGISSPVFEAMLYGPLSCDDTITITDIQPDIFQLILNYIYTDTVQITSIEQAFELLYASRKYFLDHLTELCISYIQANVSVDNVIEILNYPDYMHDKQLVTFSLKLFCEHASYLLKEKKSLINSTCMKTILESDQMNIAEKDLIVHVFEWSKLYCKDNNKSSILETRRDVLLKNGLFKLLRFLTLTSNEVDEIVTDTNNLLLPYEADNLKMCIRSSNTNRLKNLADSIGLSVIQRNVLKPQWYLCYRSPIRSVAPLTIDSNNFIIYSRLKADKSVFIHSLCVPTRMGPANYFRNNSAKVYSEQLSVSVTRESDNSIVKFTKFMDTVEYDSIVDIEFPESCFIKKEEWYKISFSWPCNRFLTYSYVGEFRDRLCTGHKITFEFDDQFLPTGACCGSFLGGLKFCL